MKAGLVGGGRCNGGCGGVWGDGVGWALDLCRGGVPIAGGCGHGGAFMVWREWAVESLVEAMALSCQRTGH